MIVVPVFNDWDCAARLVADLAQHLQSLRPSLHLVLVDDGSSEPFDRVGDALSAAGFAATVLRLVRNVGHQSAIALGLCEAVALGAGTIVIMDGDGEDRPEDVLRLIAALAENPSAIVVADRRRRSEGPAFVFYYRLYQVLFRVLTGAHISFGNFSAMNRQAAERLINMHELLLHAPACMIRSRYPLVKVPIVRGTRYAGVSRMNLLSLVLHGLTSIAVFSERTFARVLVFTAAIFGMSVLTAVAAGFLKLIGMATPGWTTTVVGTLVVVLIQSAIVSLSGLFVVLNKKRDLAFSPRMVAPGLIDGRVRFAAGVAPAAAPAPRSTPAPLLPSHPGDRP